MILHAYTSTSMYMQYPRFIIVFIAIPYSGNFRGRKLSRISRFFSHSRKFSPRNSRHATPIMQPVLAFHESFLREMLLSYRSANVFSLKNFPLYSTCQVHVPLLSSVHTHINDIPYMYVWYENSAHTCTCTYSVVVLGGLTIFAPLDLLP